MSESVQDQPISKFKHCIALMYHALYDNEAEWQALHDEEKPYAISTQAFEQHLILLQEMQCPVIEPEQLKAHTLEAWQAGVLITFDDGHRSHFTHALPILKKYGMKGLFFVTTDFTSNDPHFCSWEELQTMHQEGMVIHAHGHSHGFFATMSEPEAREELLNSHQLLKKHITAPWSMSFPGGRYTPRDVKLARQQGFSHIFTSEVDAIQPKAFIGQTTIPRFAIRNTTDLVGFRGMITPSELQLQKAKTVAWGKKTLKKLLGHHFYHWLYTLKAGRKN